MKRTAIRTTLLLSAATAYAGAFLLGACGSNSTRGAGDIFVGTWSCPQLPAGSKTVVITESLDNSLTLSNEADAGTVPFCASDLWTFSGSSATIRPSTSCVNSPDGGQVLTFNSLSLTISGNSMIVSGSETISGPGKTSQNVALSSTCQKIAN